MIRTIAYAAMQAAEGVGILITDLLDRIWPPEIPPLIGDDWTDGT